MQREYRTHGEIGVLPPEARVEMIEREIIDRSPVGKNHASIVDRLGRMFVLAAGGQGAALCAIRRSQPRTKLTNPVSKA